MKCEIIRDLMPLYLDDICSAETKKTVEEHLADCEECRKYMKQMQTELEVEKMALEDSVEEKKLLQEGAERMKEIGKKSIVDKMIIVDTLLNFLLIVTAGIIFSFGFIIIFFICDCITLTQKWKRRKLTTEWEYKQIPICESYAKISIGVKVLFVFTLVCAACILGFSQFGSFGDLIGI